MSAWQRKLDLKDVWKKAKNDEITSIKLAKEIIKRLEKLPKFNNWIDAEKESIINKFEEYIEIGDDNDDEFNFIFNDLYDWGDIKLDDKFGGKRVCWVETTF
jgi:hypothetical protein